MRRRRRRQSIQKEMPVGRRVCGFGPLAGRHPPAHSFSDDAGRRRDCVSPHQASWKRRRGCLPPRLSAWPLIRRPMRCAGGSGASTERIDRSEDCRSKQRPRSSPCGTTRFVWPGHGLELVEQGDRSMTRGSASGLRSLSSLPYNNPSCDAIIMGRPNSTDR